MDHSSYSLLFGWPLKVNRLDRECRVHAQDALRLGGVADLNVSALGADLNVPADYFFRGPTDVLLDRLSVARAKLTADQG